MTDTPLLKVRDISKFYGARIGCQNVSFDLWPGEVLARFQVRGRHIVIELDWQQSMDALFARPIQPLGQIDDDPCLKVATCIGSHFEPRPAEIARAQIDPTRDLRVTPRQQYEFRVQPRIMALYLRKCLTQVPARGV